MYRIGQIVDAIHAKTPNNRRHQSRNPATKDHKNKTSCLFAYYRVTGKCRTSVSMQCLQA